MDKNKFWLGGRLFNTAPPRLGVPTQREVRLQDGCKRNARCIRKMGAQTKNRSATKTSTQGSTRLIRPHQGWLPQRNARHVRKMGAQTQHKACPQVGRQRNARHVTTQTVKARPQVGHPNVTQVTSARWSPKRKTHPQRKRPHKGALGLKTSWRMDKKFFGLEVDFLIQPHQGWAPQRNARHVRKMGTQTQHKIRPKVGRPNATQGTSASWLPQCTSATQTQGTSRRTSASWA
jgi:hypothetical protein